jgi:murein DD-endopeptidase MepM/ murein hydrolase activator NlpD
VNDDWTSTDGRGPTSEPSPAAARPEPRTAATPRRSAAFAGDGSRDPLAAIRDIKLPPLPPRPEGPAGDEWSAEPDVDHVEVGRAQRADRQASVRARRRNTTVAVGLAAAAVFVVLATIGAIAMPREPSTTKVFASQGSGLNVKRPAAGVSQAPVVSTPVFARINRMRIYLPVDPKAITAVAFHQSAYGRSYHMVALIPTADRPKTFNLVKAGKKLPIASATSSVTGIDQRDGHNKVVESLWKGSLVRLWRTGRSGAPDSAADCGAKAGTTVVAAVSGKVERIRPYMLYNKYPDYEIHIKPDGMPHADMVVIHVQDLIVKPGDRVTGGITPIAHVRLLSNRMVHQLAEYTGDPGDHVHIQFNWPKSGNSATPSGD